MLIIQEDEAEVVQDKRWQRDSVRYEIRKLNAPFKEAQKDKRWNAELECYMDPQDNPVVDPSKVDFDAVKNLFPDQDTYHTRRLSEKGYEANLMNKLKEFFEASLPKAVEMRKRKKEEMEKLIEEMKRTTEDADEEEQRTEKSQVPNETEVNESSELLNVGNTNKNENQCRNCIEMCKVCTEKDEKIKIKEIEINKKF
ncbi:hypothetical protein Hanom_Chr02g00124991 [Helianthus anomalus]